LRRKPKQIGYSAGYLDGLRDRRKKKKAIGMTPGINKDGRYRGGG